MRVDTVLADGRVDEHDGDGGVAALVEREHPALVTGEVGGDPPAQGVVVGERRGDRRRHEPIVAPATMCTVRRVAAEELLASWNDTATRQAIVDFVAG